MNRPAKKEDSSGSVRIEGSSIMWDYKEETILTLKKEDIVVIGEYTNSDGPYFDDWFIVFVTKDGDWRSIPWYVDNVIELETFLCNNFQPDLNTSHLAGSTVWNSIIRYPMHLKGKPLFELTLTEEYKAPKTLFDKLLYSIGLGNFNTDQNIDLTEEVKGEVRNASR